MLYKSAVTLLSALCNSVPVRDRSIVISLSVCLFVCLSAIISPELRVRLSPSVQCMLPTVVARSSGGVRYVMYFRFVDDVLFAPNGPCGACRVDTVTASDVVASSCAG